MRTYSTFCLLVLILLVVAREVAAKSAWLDEEDNLREEDVTDSYHQQEQHHSEGTDEVYSHKRHSTDLATLDKSEQIALLENDLLDLRSGRLATAMDRTHRATSTLKAVKGNAGWFPNAETKARIAQLDQEVNRRMNELAAVQRDEKAIVAKLKPLYGIVSAHFVQEQKANMASSLKTLQEMSYNQAWYSSLFNAHRAESLSDVILGFFIEWLLGYLIMYPFAVVYYAFWTLPWSLYEYSSGVESIIPAVVAYVLSVFIMALPFLCIVGGIFYFVHKNWDAIRRSAEQHQQRRQQQQQQQAAFRGAPLHGRPY